MARMIPAELDPACKSPGERELFRRLRDDPKTSDWIVLHSLDLANHPRQVEGEADFVVIIPGKGVLCLEVKAHRRIERGTDGLWYFGSDPKGQIRSPFKQAAEARHALYKSVTERRPDLARVVFWSAVIMPYVNFSERSPEWHRWQVIDCQGLRAHPIGTLLLQVMEMARLHLSTADSAAWFFPQSREPYIDQCDGIAEILRPRFEVHENPKARAERLDQEVKHYTEEQFMALDAMEHNPRVAFTGPAGSGKTLLALEAARRGAAEGRRILLLCFNKHLGQWLEDQAGPIGAAVTVNWLHRHMLSCARVKPTGEPGFWESILPALALDKLLDQDSEEHIYDELIIDEAQDILRTNYLDFLDFLVKGGLGAGRWRLFGDFEKQNIYNKDPDAIPLPDFLKGRGNRAPQFDLRVNCRNTPRVAGMAELLGGLNPGYKRYLRPDDRVEPEVGFYQNDEHQQQVLVELLQRLYTEQYAGRDIVVLSPRADQTSAAGQCRQAPWSDRLKPWEQAGPGHVPYCSIHAFKGLEAKVVVVTDVNRVTTEYDQELLYVAATRSLHRLLFLAQEGFREDYLKALLQRTSG